MQGVAHPALHVPVAAERALQNVAELHCKQAAIVDEFVGELGNAAPKVTMCVRDACPRCSTAFVVRPAQAIMRCPQCGYAVTYLDSTSNATSFDEVLQYSPYSYKRINHFCTHLSLAQGKETYRVPQADMDVILHYLVEQRGVVDKKDITIRLLHEVLRTLRLRKVYDHVVQVHMRLTGTMPTRITKHQEQVVRNLFLQLQPAFEKHVSGKRTNFLSYTYVLYRCLERLGHAHVLGNLVLLKGREKLEANDVLFRTMARELGWGILPPLPD